MLLIAAGFRFIRTSRVDLVPNLYPEPWMSYAHARRKQRFWHSAWNCACSNGTNKLANETAVTSLRGLESPRNSTCITIDNVASRLCCSSKLPDFFPRKVRLKDFLQRLELDTLVLNRRKIQISCAAPGGGRRYFDDMFQTHKMCARKSSDPVQIGLH